MSNILVTGAGGFIGGAVARKLVEAGKNVITIDNFSTGNEAWVPANVKIIKGDCQDEKVIAQLKGIEFEAIYHIAGQSSGEISFDNPVYDLQTNAQSTLMLLKFARENNCKKFVYASTMSVYGDQDKLPVDENTCVRPKSFYAVGKLASEGYLKIYGDLGINCTALRLFNVYGPGQNMDNLRQGMVSIFLAQAIKDRSIVVKGSRDRFRDFVYIDDVVNAFLEAGKPGGENYRVLNVASGKKTTVGELIDKIVQSMGSDIRVQFEGSTPGDQFGIYADVSAIQKALNWQPTVDFDNGLKRTLKSLGL